MSLCVAGVRELICVKMKKHLHLLNGRCQSSGTNHYVAEAHHRIADRD